MRTSAMINGVKIPMTIAGDGPGLLLVHGTGPGADVPFGHLIEPLAQNFRVVMPDLSGSPTVHDDGAGLTVETLANQVLGVADAAGIEEHVLLGFSLGGPVAVTAAALAPSRVRGLVVAAGWLRTSDDPYLKLLYDIWQRSASDPDLFGRFSTLTGFSPSHIASLPTNQLHELFSNLYPNPHVQRQIELGARLDISRYAPQVAAPTMLIAGAHDATIPPHSVARLAAAIPDSQLVTLDCGHVMTFEKPDEFVELITEFAPASRGGQPQAAH